MGQRHDHLKLLLAERDTAHEREVRDLVDRYERELREVADALLERRVDMLERSPTPGTVRHLEDVATSQAFGFVQTAGAGAGMLAFGPIAARIGCRGTFALMPEGPIRVGGPTLDHALVTAALKVAEKSP